MNPQLMKNLKEIDKQIFEMNQRLDISIGLDNLEEQLKEIKNEKSRM